MLVAVEGSWALTRVASWLGFASLGWLSAGLAEREQTAPSHLPLAVKPEETADDKAEGIQRL